VRRTLALLMLIVGCGDDDGAGSGMTPNAESTSDASLADTSAPAPVVDAASSRCAAGELLCDDTCIAGIAPTGEAVTSRIFRTSCGFASSCHGGTSPKQGLALDTVDNLFATAVGKSSTQTTDRLLVSPGQPERSYLLDKLLGQNLASATSVMPEPPLETLCAAKIEVVRAWINAGAVR
jgi:hypothetical protein